MTPNDPNRLFVIGNIMGQVGVVTWNGYDVFQEIQNKEGYDFTNNQWPDV